MYHSYLQKLMPFAVGFANGFVFGKRTHFRGVFGGFGFRGDYAAASRRTRLGKTNPNWGGCGVVFIEKCVRVGSKQRQWLGCRENEPKSIVALMRYADKTAGQPGQQIGASNGWTGTMRLLQCPGVGGRSCERHSYETYRYRDRPCVVDSPCGGTAAFGF